MRGYFSRKLLIYAVTFFLAATIDWVLPRLMPGDPIQSLLSRMRVLDQDSANALVAYYKGVYSLDKPIWEQFIGFWVNLAHGNLGLSLYGNGRPVADMIMAALPYTLLLLIPAILVSWWAGNNFGALAARSKVLDNSVLPIGYTLTATPYMWLALILAYVFAFTLRWLPLGLGYSQDLQAPSDWLADPNRTAFFLFDVFRHWLLPFFSLFIVQFGGWAIGMRNMIIYELESDYSHYLDALGAPKSLIRKYAFRNAVLPQITGLALQLGVVVAGSLVTEIVFQYPGLGTLVFNAITREDYFLLQGIFLFIIVGVLIANFIVDLVYVLVDPRTRLGMRGEAA